MTDSDLRAPIEIRAYQIWEDEGRPHGRDLDHWLRAAAEIETGDAVVDQAAVSPDDDNAARRPVRRRARA